jgi:Ca-activated chloride channel homolog
MLPVEIEDKGQIEDPKVAMAVMLDRSGSMGAMVGTHNKLQLAVEAALAAASTLRADDLLAIGSVDEETHWDEPFGPVSNLAPRREQIRSIDVGGGGILIFTALVDAYRTLNHAAAPVRHVILFADTADSEEQTDSCQHGGCSGPPRTAEELAQAAHRLGVTTSVVGIGREEDSDTPFLRRLAASGGGRFYITGDATDLRRIFVSETRVAARSNLREGPVAVTVVEDHPILAGADLGAMPPLGGFVETNRRATASVALATKDDDKPILASWRYGLGQVVVLTSDLRADWKAGWSSFAGGGKVLSQLVRFAMRRHSGGGADLRAAVHDRGVEIGVDLAEVPGEKATPPSRVDAFAVSADGTSRQLKLGAGLERAAPGRFVAHGRTEGEPFVVVRAYDENGAIVGETIGRIDDSAELAELGPDVRALSELSRLGYGLYDPEPEQTLRDEGPRGQEPVPVWPWILIASAALVAVDLWLRRTGKRGGMFALPVSPLAADDPRRPRAPAPALAIEPAPEAPAPPAQAA